MIVGLLAAMATAALAQDPNPNGNRMNDPLLRVQKQESTARLAGLPDPTVNRLNVAYGTGAATELTGGPSPNRNRMNVEWPKAKELPPVVKPPAVEPRPTDPNPSP
jgi:hypothetical protein